MFVFQVLGLLAFLCNKNKLIIEGDILMLKIQKCWLAAAAVATTVAIWTSPSAATEDSYSSACKEIMRYRCLTFAHPNIWNSHPILNDRGYEEADLTGDTRLRVLDCKGSQPGWNISVKVEAEISSFWGSTRKVSGWTADRNLRPCGL